MKKCSKCNYIKSFSSFNKNKARKDGLNNYCKQCSLTYYLENRSKHLEIKKRFYDENKNIMYSRNRKNYENDKVSRMWYSAKYRAKTKNLPFNIEKSDILIPEFCPVLGIKLETNLKETKPNSPSLDRIFPEKGYVKGNIMVISMKANQIKTNASLNELRAVYEFYKDKIL